LGIRDYRLKRHKEEEGGSGHAVDCKLQGLDSERCEDRVLDGPASGEKGSKGRNSVLTNGVSPSMYTFKCKSHLSTAI